MEYMTNIDQPCDQLVSENRAQQNCSLYLERIEIRTKGHIKCRDNLSSDTVGSLLTNMS